MTKASAPLLKQTGKVERGIREVVVQIHAAHPGQTEDQASPLIGNAVLQFEPSLQSTLSRGPGLHGPGRGGRGEQGGDRTGEAAGRTKRWAEVAFMAVDFGGAGSPTTATC